MLALISKNLALKAVLMASGAIPCRVLRAAIFGVLVSAYSLNKLVSTHQPWQKNNKRSIFRVFD